MKLYLGNGKSLKLHIGELNCKIMDNTADIIEFFINQINTGIKTIEDVPSILKSSVEKGIN